MTRRNDRAMDALFAEVLDGGDPRRAARQPPSPQSTHERRARPRRDRPCRFGTLLDETDLHISTHTALTSKEPAT